MGQAGPLVAHVLAGLATPLLRCAFTRNSKEPGDGFRLFWSMTAGIFVLVSFLAIFPYNLHKTQSQLPLRLVGLAIWKQGLGPSYALSLMSRMQSRFFIAFGSICNCISYPGRAAVLRAAAGTRTPFSFFEHRRQHRPRYLFPLLVHSDRCVCLWQLVESRHCQRRQQTHWLQQGFRVCTSFEVPCPADTFPF